MSRKELRKFFKIQQSKLFLIINKRNIIIWNWTLSKIGISVGLGTISSNPLYWAIGLSTSQLIKLKSKESLNSSNLNISDKETAQRLIELSTNYQVQAGFGVILNGLGTVTNKISKETLKIGKQAGKEIAIHGFKNKVARTLTYLYMIFRKSNKIIKLLISTKII